MKAQIIAFALASLGCAGIAMADSVTDPVAKKRVELMDSIRGNFAMIGGMAQGKTGFDAGKAAGAKAALADDAKMIPTVFKEQASDPADKASPAIWENWDDFAAHAQKLADAAEALDVSSADTLKAGFGGVAKTCGACHSVYRTQ